MSGQVWTKRWPTEPGLYWTMMDGPPLDDSPQIVEVTRDPEGTLRANAVGWENWFTEGSRPKIAEWWWPVRIDPPESRP